VELLLRAMNSDGSGSLSKAELEAWLTLFLGDKVRARVLGVGGGGFRARETCL